MTGIPLRLALCALALCGSADASVLSRCVGEGGAVAIQDSPCPPHARTSWTRPARPEDRPAQELDRIRHDQQQRMDDAQRLAYIAGTLPHPSSRARATTRRKSAGTRPSRCDIAKKHREDVLANRSRDASYDARRALNDDVFDACK